GPGPPQTPVGFAWGRRDPPKKPHLGAPAIWRVRSRSLFARPLPEELGASAAAAPSTYADSDARTLRALQEVIELELRLTRTYLGRLVRRAHEHLAVGRIALAEVMLEPSIALPILVRIRPRIDPVQEQEVG